MKKVLVLLLGITLLSGCATTISTGVVYYNPMVPVYYPYPYYPYPVFRYHSPVYCPPVRVYPRPR